MSETALMGDLAAMMAEIGARARQAAHGLASASSEAKNRALNAAAEALRANKQAILNANAEDLRRADETGLSDALVDRLSLNEARIEAIARGLEEVAALPDPVGQIMAEWTRPNGLRIQRVRVPIGVIGIIYESRPNVTADAGGLCLKSGNAAILRGGSESFRSSSAIMECLKEGLRDANLPVAAIQYVPTRDRDAVGLMLRMTESIDLIVPRGGRMLIERVLAESKIPVLRHLDGLCHVYIHRDADPEMARKVAYNAKMRRPGICGAAETFLVDSKVLKTHLPPLLDDLFKAGCEVRGDAQVQALDRRIVAATEKDWDTEYLDAIVSIKTVDGLDDAIDHVNRHGSHHTDSIVTNNEAAAERFLKEVDSGIVLHNASTQFADGGEFGMGAEIGISTSKLHARGPVGAEQLTTFKYVVRGAGQVRP